MRLVLIVAAGLLAAVQAHAQASKFDGDYGAANGTMGSGSACNTTRFGFKLAVKNGQATLRTVTAGPLEGPVKDDGSIDIMQGHALLQGRIEGGKFTGTLSIGSRCQFALNYTRN